MLNVIDWQSIVLINDSFTIVSNIVLKTWWHLQQITPLHNAFIHTYFAMK